MLQCNLGGRVMCGADIGRLERCCDQCDHDSASGYTFTYLYIYSRLQYPSRQYYKCLSLYLPAILSFTS